MLLESDLMNATQTVVDIYSRFLFESDVFEARKTHTPSPEELDGMMLRAQDAASVLNKLTEETNGRAEAVKTEELFDAWDA